MTDSSSVTNHVGCYIARSVLGRSGKGFQREVERFQTKNGIEWTNNRLKAIWTAANHLRNKEKDKAIQIYQSNSISYHKSDGTPKGPLRPAVRSYVLAQRPARIRSHAAVLRFYCALRLTKLSKQQSEKAYEAITSLPIRYQRELDTGNIEACLSFDKQLERMASNDIRIGGLNVLSQLVKKVDSGLIPPEYIPPIKDRYADGLRPTTYCYSRHRLPKGINCRDPYMAMAQSFMTEPWCPTPLDTMTPCFEMRELVRSQGFDDQRFVGKIGVIQEAGCKARVVAMPSAWVQLAFLPMHTRLDRINRHLDVSCVHDQLKGAYVVLGHMYDGKSAYGVDLSSATDRFPRQYSSQILRDIGMSNYADALEEVCAQDWDSPWGPVKYATGQPMGLYGSFPLFNLSHAVFAAARCAEVNSYLRKEKEAGREVPTVDLFHTGEPFYVLGDDIVFSDRLYADHYTRTLESLEIPVSHHKSFGGQVCEFAGFLVMRNDRDECTAFRPYKVPDSPFPTNPLQALHAVGPKLTNWKPSWKKKFDHFRKYQNHRAIDLTPLITEEDRRGANPYRGDTLTVKNACQCLSMWHDEHILPDLSGNTRINSIPLFAERGMFDFYGFNPEELRVSDQELRQARFEPYRVRQLYKDPLMARALREEKQQAAESAIPEPPSAPIHLEGSSGDWKREDPLELSLPFLQIFFRKELDDAADGCPVIPNFYLLRKAPDNVSLGKDWEKYSYQDRLNIHKLVVGESIYLPVSPDVRLLLHQEGYGLCPNQDLKDKPRVTGDFPFLGVHRSQPPVEKSVSKTYSRSSRKRGDNHQEPKGPDAPSR